MLLLTDPAMHNLTIEAFTETRVSLCGVVWPAVQPTEIKRIFCRSETLGRFVKITKKAAENNVLLLCEVEVYGTKGISSINLERVFVITYF